MVGGVSQHHAALRLRASGHAGKRNLGGCSFTCLVAAAAGTAALVIVVAILYAIRPASLRGGLSRATTRGRADGDDALLTEKTAPHYHRKETPSTLQQVRGPTGRTLQNRRAMEAEGVAVPPVKPMRPLVKGVDYFADYDAANVTLRPIESPTYTDPSGTRYFEYVNATGEYAADFAMAYVSNEPRVLYVQDLLSADECDALVALAKPQLARSNVVPHLNSKESTVSDIRTSSQTWLQRETSPVVAGIMDRILAITGFAASSAEQLQILRYEKSQKYDAHNDYFDPRMYGAQKTNRALTAYLYLSDVEEGGETQFPRADGKPPTFDYASCNRGLRVRPRKGQAAFFYDMKPNGELDASSLHGGCPVKRGTKWGGTLWLRIPTGGAPVMP